MKKSKLSAVTLRAVLSTTIVLVIGLAAFGFSFAQSWLSDLAVSVSHTVADSTTSSNNVQALHKLQDELQTRQDIISRVSSLFTSKQTYQIQAVKDLTAYAAATGISISNYTFPAEASLSSPATTVTLTLTSPVPYVGLLKFMSAIEGNLPKMQISSINLGRIDGDTQSARVDQLTIEVSTI